MFFDIFGGEVDQEISVFSSSCLCPTEVVLKTTKKLVDGGNDALLASFLDSSAPVVVVHRKAVTYCNVMSQSIIQQNWKSLQLCLAMY